jgi:hypothetical protein
LGNQQGSPDNLRYTSSFMISRAFCSVSTPDYANTYSLYYWIAGFIEGEGSFNVSFKLKADLRMGIQISPELSVTQHVDGKAVC